MQPSTMRTAGRGGVTVNVDAGCRGLNKENVASEVRVPVQQGWQ